MIYEDNQTMVHFGDVRDTISLVPDSSVHTAITSPPYFNLRSYLDSQHEHKSLEIGSEPTVREYVDNIVSVFGEVRRVLRSDGTVWLNVGDSYAASGKGGNKEKGMYTYREGKEGSGRRHPHEGFKPKDLMLIPHRIAIALQDDGWYLRSSIVWHKPNPMPEPVTDRPTSSYEMIFLLSKSPRYFYDAFAVKEEAKWERWGKHTQPKYGGNDTKTGWIREKSKEELEAKRSDGRNQRNVWTIPTKPYAEAHFATFPIEIPLRCIKAATSEHGVCEDCGSPYKRITSRNAESKYVEPSKLDRFGTGEAGVHRNIGQKYSRRMEENPMKTTGWEATCACKGSVKPATVFDPFMGSGTTALAAKKLGRRSVGLELNEDCYGLIGNRLGQQSLFF